MSPANCTVLKVLKNDRYNVSVTSIHNTSLVYTTISEAKKEGFKDFQRGQKLKCFYSEDYRHGYVKWQVQFHSGKKNIDFSTWFNPSYLFSMWTFSAAYAGLFILALGKLAKENWCPYCVLIILAVVLCLPICLFVCAFFFCPLIALFLHIFIFRERKNLIEASCVVLKALTNDQYNVSVTPVVSVIEPFTLIEKATKKGFNDTTLGQKLLCYYAVVCVENTTEDSNCILQFHTRVADVNMADALFMGFLILLLVSVIISLLVVGCCKIYNRKERLNRNQGNIRSTVTRTPNMSQHVES